jgi:outer membrane protein insertion porin family
MIRPTIKICLFLYLSLFLNAQQINNITVEGNSLFSENEYLSVIENSGLDLSSTSIKDTVKERASYFLYEKGYYNFSLEVTQHNDTSNILMTVKEGKPTFVDAINIVNTGLTDSLYFMQTVNSLQGKIFSKENVSNIFSELIHHYENIGYPFYSVKIDSLFFHGNENNFLVDLFISPSNGRLCRFDKFIFKGNEKTKDYVLERELRIGKSELYNQEIVDDIPAILNKTGFFRKVENPEFLIDETGKGILRITLEEKNTNNFDGILGYVPGSGNTKGYFTGFVNINLRNLFGTGRAALIKWNQETQSTQELELKYFEPWLFSYPFSLSLGLYQRKQDSTYVQRNLNTELDYVADKNITASFLASSESVIPSENSLPENTVYNSSQITTGLSLRIDTRDDLYAPRSGLLFINSYKYTSKTIEDETLTDVNSDNNLQRFEVDLSFYKTIFTSQVVSLALHAREMRGSFIELSDLYFLGGTSTLRGYRERQFSGNRLIWSNLEYRYLFDIRSYFFLFLDSGYFMRREEPRLNVSFYDDYKTGYGLGISLETAIGILKVSYALGEGDSFSEGKIHFGIANDF